MRSDGPRLEISLTEARRAAVAAQRLSGKRPDPNTDGLKEIAQAIRVLQIDPTNVVARTQLLVLRSRLGNFDPKLLDELVWRERFLFHYFAHQASLVLTEDFPIFQYHMRHAFDRNTAWGKRVLDWIDTNRALRAHILRRLRRADGPLRTRDFEDRSVEPWQSTGWTAARNISRMLEFLWAMGKVTIGGRAGNERLWDLTDRWLPKWTPAERLSRREVVERSAAIAVRCLGVATPRHIKAHFTRGAYPELDQALRSLHRRGEIEEVSIPTLVETTPEPWYIHREQLLILSEATGDWRPRTTLLSPFDNLICDRERTEVLFGFHFRLEIYVPKAERRFGFYVLPILHSERFIGRIDAAVDRRRGVLRVHAVHAEPDAPTDRGTADAVGDALQGLADFVSDGRLDVSRSGIAPSWRRLIG